MLLSLKQACRVGECYAHITAVVVGETQSVTYLSPPSELMTEVGLEPGASLFIAQS